MGKVLLHGGNAYRGVKQMRLSLGDTVYCLGYDMQCRYTVEQCHVIEVMGNGNVVVRNVHGHPVDVILRRTDLYTKE